MNRDGCKSEVMRILINADAPVDIVLIAHECAKEGVVSLYEPDETDAFCNLIDKEFRFVTTEKDDSSLVWFKNENYSGEK